MNCFFVLCWWHIAQMTCFFILCWWPTSLYHVDDLLLHIMPICRAQCLLLLGIAFMPVTTSYLFKIWQIWSRESTEYMWEWGPFPVPNQDPWKSPYMYLPNPDKIGKSSVGMFPIQISLSQCCIVQPKEIYYKKLVPPPGQQSLWTWPYSIWEHGNGWTRQVFVFWDMLIFKTCQTHSPFHVFQNGW